MTKRKFLSYFPLDGIAVALMFVVCFCFWQTTYHLKTKWPGLPPAANKIEAVSYGYGDKELSYRVIGLMLQNAGDTGGQTTSLRDYNFKNVGDWLWVTYDLDPKANYVPSLAAFYFGAAKGKERLGYLVDYLARVGKDDGAEKWRWLAHAVYIARFQIDDQEKALKLARELAAIKSPDMPLWTQQMPAFVMTKVGKKKAARDLMLTIMATDKTIDPADINQTCWYINKHLRESDDGLDKNEVYQAFCSHEWDTQKKNKS